MNSGHLNVYYDVEKTRDAVQRGEHRNWIGGVWDEIGRMQFEFLRDRDLLPDMRLIDIGCGCLRGGVHFVRYLRPGNYYGIDLSQALLDAGYDIELAALGLQHKLPRTNLLANADFDASRFGVAFDVALAQSVFTHLPLNHFKICRRRSAGYMKPGSRMYVTVFLSPPGHDWVRPLAHQRGGIITHPERDPFHYERDDLVHTASGSGWGLEEVVDWDHPRNQMMAVFRRGSD